MVIAVIKVDGFFWEIRKEKKKIEIVKIDEGILEKVYTDVPCLLADTKGVFMKHMIFDKEEDDSSIENTGASLLETKNYYTFIETFRDKKIAFYVKKADIVKLFKEFAFGKIIPLDVILFRMAIKYKAEIVGIIGEKYFSYSRKVSFESLDTFFANEGEFSSLLFEPNANISFFLEAISRMLHLKKAIFTDKEIPQEELEEKNVISVKAEEFFKIVSEENTFVIYDRFSDNYRSKIYRKILIASSAIMAVASFYFMYGYVNAKSVNERYERMYENLNERLAMIKAEERKYQTDYLYKIYSPFDFMKFYETVKPIADTKGIIEYRYVKKNFPKAMPAEIKVKIEGIDNFLAFEKRYGKYIVSYKVSPKDDTIEALIVLNDKRRRK